MHSPVRILDYLVDTTELKFINTWSVSCRLVVLNSLDSASGRFPYFWSEPPSDQIPVIGLPYPHSLRRQNRILRKKQLVLLTAGIIFLPEATVARQVKKWRKPPIKAGRAIIIRPNCRACSRIAIISCCLFSYDVLFIQTIHHLTLNHSACSSSIS